MKLIRTMSAVLLGGLLLQSPLALAQATADGDAVIMLPFPDRIEPLKAPVNAMLSYGKATTRDFITDITWGPEKAPGLYNMRATGKIEIAVGDEGPVATLTRAATIFTLGPKVTTQGDAGTITAPLTAQGRFRRIELNMPSLDTRAHWMQFGVLGRGLIDTGAILPFQRASGRTGPDDSAGPAQARREKEARAEVLEALQPLLGLISEMPQAGLSSGTRLTVLRRDLGDLFRDAGPVPLRIEGTVAGVAEIDNRRFLALRLDRAEMGPPMRARVEGYALIDVETALTETLVAAIELIVLQGTDAISFRFVERRALMPMTK